MFAINTGWSKSILLSPHDFQNELLEILPFNSIVTWCKIWHLSISKCNSSVQKMVRNFAYNITVIGSADLCHCKQGNSKKTCQSAIAKSKPKATNYECSECIIPSVLCWISSSSVVRFFPASLSLIPVVISFSSNFCWASEDHDDFWVFSTLSVYRWVHDITLQEHVWGN